MNDMNVWSMSQYKWWCIKDNLKLVCDKIKWSYQRITRGYSDADIWDLDCFLNGLYKQVFKSLAETTHGYPGIEDANTPEEWEEILYKMTYLAECMEEDNPHFSNKYAEQYDALLMAARNNRTTEHTEIIRKYCEEEHRIYEKRNQSKNEMYDLLKKWHFHLWD